MQPKPLGITPCAMGRELLLLLRSAASAIPMAVAPGRGDVPAGPLAPEGAGLGARPEIPGGELGGVVTPGKRDEQLRVVPAGRGGRTGVPARRPWSCLALGQGPWHPAGPRHCR